MQPVAFLIDVPTAKKLTDEYIQDFCQRRASEAMELGPTYAQLWQSIEKLILAGGKRFRPYMLLATYQAYQPTQPLASVLPAAVAQELIHSAMLVHDDIIDRDTIRYGVQNIAGQYTENYKAFVHDETERAHMSLSAALLAGDALIADAHKVLRKTELPTHLIDHAQDILNSVIFEVIGGELLDTEVAFLPKGSISAHTIARYKTASYSFVGPITTGAVLAEAPETDITILREFSIMLGVGYQLRDDILGTFGDEAVTGKSITTDIKEGKRTYLIEQFDILATTEQAQKFNKIFRRYDATNDEIQIAKQLLIDTGALHKVEQKINELHQQSLDKIEQLSLSDETKKIYKGLVEYCLSRDK